MNTPDINTFVANVNLYLEHIKADYTKWGGDSSIRQEMVKEFVSKVDCEFGKKYIKVVTGNSVHSFICMNDDGKFKAGDILMAATWKAPARNFARGNVLNKDWSRARWTGIH